MLKDETKQAMWSKSIPMISLGCLYSLIMADSLLFYFSSSSYRLRPG